MEIKYLQESEWVSLGDANSSEILAFCISLAEGENIENKECSFGFKSTSEINSESKYWRNLSVLWSWYEFNWSFMPKFSSNEWSIIAINYSRIKTLRNYCNIL